MAMDYMPPEPVQVESYPQAYHYLVDLPDRIHAGQLRPPVAESTDTQLGNETTVSEADVRPGDMVSPAVRMKVIREAAITLAVRNGLSWRYKQIMKSLKVIEPALDQQYDFSRLMLKNNVMPPVIVESGPAWSTENRTSASESKLTYEIVRDARIVSTAPNWRSYLMREFSWNYEVPNAVLPETAHERSTWESGLQHGWRHGIQYADRLFDENLARMERDFIGSSRYLLLAKQGIVSDVISVRGSEQVVRKGRLLSIGQSQIRLARDSDYRPMNEWRPVVIEEKKGW